MRKLSLLFLSFAVLLPLRAYAYCYGVTGGVAPITPPGHVCGTVYRAGYNNTYGFVTKPAGQSTVKICPAGQTTGCSTVGTATYSDAYGNPVQAFNFYNFAYGATTTSYWDLYAYATSSTDYWGTPTVSIYRNVAIGGNGQEGIGLYMRPRPLEPATVYPSGTSVGNSYTIRWKSGRDIDRQPYDITYSIYYKYWAFGDMEPYYWTLSRSGMPCHDSGSNTPDVNNECTTYVAGPQPAGNWKWYVVAKLDATPYLSNLYLSTESGSRSFTQPNP